LARSGVSQEAVNNAADQLLQGGVRPTIERVRAALGTGSPNTLIRLLDRWWADLGDRLRVKDEKIVLPHAPEPVVQAASALWVAALEHATDIAQRTLSSEREEVEKAREVLSSDRAAMDADNAVAAEASRRAREALTAVEDRCGDLQRLVELQAAQIIDLTTQRDASSRERISLTERLEAAASQREVQAAAVLAERLALETQHRATEDRWLQEVDRARQDAARTQSTLTRLEMEHSDALRAAFDQVSSMQAGLQSAEQVRIGQAAQLAALGAELKRWHAGRGAKVDKKKIPASQRGTVTPTPDARKGRRRARTLK